MTARAWLLSCYNTSTVSIPQTSIRDWRLACLPACSTRRSCLRNIYIAACPPLSVPSSHAEFDQNVNIRCGLLWRYRNSTGFLTYLTVGWWHKGCSTDESSLSSSSLCNLQRNLCARTHMRHQQHVHPLQIRNNDDDDNNDKNWMFLLHANVQWLKISSRTPLFIKEFSWLVLMWPSLNWCSIDDVTPLYRWHQALFLMFSTAYNSTWMRPHKVRCG